MAKQRNNVAKMPAEARFRVSQLLDDGATYDAIRADAEVAAACGLRKLALHNNSIAAYAESAEHQANLGDLRTWKERVGRRRWAARAIAGADGAASLADVAQLQILEQLSQLAEGGIELTGENVCKVSNSIAAMQRVELARQKVEADTRLADAERRHEAEAAAWQAKLDQLVADNKRMKEAIDRAGISLESGRQTVDLGKVGEAMDELLGAK
jgi:hypothetical protein